MLQQGVQFVIKHALFSSAQRFQDVAFTAGYISGILENKSDIECLEIGSALGASCVRAQGTTEGVFKKEECFHFLAENKLNIKKLS